jgi:hypothetical protein
MSDQLLLMRNPLQGQFCKRGKRTSRSCRPRFEMDDSTIEAVVTFKTVRAKLPHQGGDRAHLRI